MTTLLKIKIYCNPVLGGWSPTDRYQTSASELGLRELAFELAKIGHTVTVYHNGKHGTFDGVSFVSHSEFDAFEECDVFMSFKDITIWEQTIDAKVKIHFTTELGVFNNNQIDKIVCISEYHKRRYIELNPNTVGKVVVIPVGMYFRGGEKEKEWISLYSSSPDRGLGSICRDYKKEYPQLYVTFGWDKFELYNLGNMIAMKFRDNVRTKLEELNAVETGKLSISEMDAMYSKARFWVYPMETDIPDSELMCQSALYAQLYHCTPVIREVGALPETVKHYIKWEDWNGSDTLSYEKLVDNFKHAKEYLWQNVMKKWDELIVSLLTN